MRGKWIRRYRALVVRERFGGIRVGEIELAKSAERVPRFGVTRFQSYAALDPQQICRAKVAIG